MRVHQAVGERQPAKGYEVSYRDNKKLGYGTVTVTGKGDYSGFASAQFRIVPKKTAIAKASKSKTSATVKWERQSAKMSGKKIASYQVRTYLKGGKEILYSQWSKKKPAR